jgi:ferric-dicitrate binding protein FerR (iron transport regulator)
MVDRTLRSESVWPWSPPALRAHLARCEACRGVPTLLGFDDGLGELERMSQRGAEVALPAPPPPSPWARARWAVPVAAGLAIGLWLWSSPGVAVGVVVAAERLVVAGEDVRPGARVFEGEDVVASGGRAVVRLEGGRVVLINEGSRVRFVRGGAHAMLASGAAYFRVEKGAGPFEVTAGSATVIVKGTRFLVARRDLESASVAVEEGVVEVRTGAGSLEVRAGQETLVTGEAIGVPKSIDLLEQLRRGIQQAGRDLDRIFGSP